MPGPAGSKAVETFLEELSKPGNKNAKEVEKDFFKKIRPTSSLQRFANVEEIMSTTVYFSGPLAAATNNASICVKGKLIRSIL